METLNPTKPSAKVPPLEMGQAFIRGQIAARRRMNGKDGGFWLSVIKMPAKDEYSHPKTIEVNSRSALGDVGDVWTGIVDVGGYARSYNTKPDPDTGEVKKISTADNHLHVIES